MLVSRKSSSHREQKVTGLLRSGSAFVLKLLCLAKVEGRRWVSWYLEDWHCLLMRRTSVEYFPPNDRAREWSLTNVVVCQCRCRYQ